MRGPNAESSEDRLRRLEDRIKQLGDKANQLLIFLSFALVVAVILGTQGNKQLGPRQAMLLIIGMRFWASALFPILISVLPLKEIREGSEKWYSAVRWIKFWLLWPAIVCIFIGTIFFVCAIWRVGVVQW
jgi:membrane protease YdiL (CAAX protease family)